MSIVNSLLAIDWADILDKIDWELLGSGLWDTLQMTFVSLFFTVLFGLPLGVFLFLTSPNQAWENRVLYGVLSFIVNILRSVPFIILLVILLPLTKLMVGTKLGVAGAIPPLVFASVPFFARLVENVIREMDNGILEACKSMGASVHQMVFWAILPEATTGILAAIVVTAISLVGYTAMAGVVGAGGLGDVAIRYGYNRFEPVMLYATVPILIVLVQLIQTLGDYMIARLNKRSGS